MTALLWSIKGSENMGFDDIKIHNGKQYSGMRVGGSHVWDYYNATWEETKVAQDLWKIKFDAIKGRKVAAPENSGAPLFTGYHWLIIADQRVAKINKDEYQTVLEGSKFKIGHRRPYWKDWSYAYSGQMTYRQKLIQIFRSTLEKLEQEEREAIA